MLTYRDVRLSTNAGVLLGIFEVGVFLALAIWILLSNGIPSGVLDPTNAEAGTYNGIFKGMVFAILAFIGFEAAAPLGEEARRPRWTVPRAVIGSCIAIGIFYFVCSVAWVAGTGFDNFAAATAEQANPWRHLGEVFWSTGWILIFLAIINSALANSNAGVNAASRVIYTMGRNGRSLRARSHDAPGAQDAARGDHLDERSSRWCSALLVGGQAGGRSTGVRAAGDDGRAGGDHRLHADLRSAACKLLPRPRGAQRSSTRCLHLDAARSRGIVLFFFPLYYQFVQGAADLSDQVRRTGSRSRGRCSG